MRCSGYCLLGGLTFEQLEREHELAVKREMGRQRDRLADTIWDLTAGSEVPDTLLTKKNIKTNQQLLNSTKTLRNTIF